MKLNIRDMEISDIDRVIEIERISFPTPWPKEIFKREVQRSFDGLYLVVEMDGAVQGYTGIIKILDVGHITTMAVHPDFRGRGLATNLLFELITRAKKMGTRYMTLEVRESNVMAQNLYRRFGFSEVGKRRGYYIDNNEDAVIMWSGDIQNANNKKMLKNIQETTKIAR